MAPSASKREGASIGASPGAEPLAVTAEQKRKVVNTICVSAFMSVCQHIVCVQTEPRLFLQLCKNDAAEAARILGNTSGIVGVLSLIINQTGGKFSDMIGRKLGFLLGPFANIFLGLLVYKNPGNAMLVSVCRTLRLIFTTFSSTVMCQASLADVCTSGEMALATTQMGTATGVAMLIVPFVEARLMSKGLHHVYLALSAFGAAHLAFNITQIRETLPPSKRKEGQLDWKAVNPFGFVRIFTEGSRPLQKLTVITTMQMFLEGKNVSDTAMIWIRDHLKWTVTGIRNFVIIYGTLCTLAGKFITPRLLSTMTSRRFTSCTNLLNAFAFSIRGLAPSTLLWLACMIPMLPGVNGASATKLKAVAVGMATAEGFGKGEFSAWINNLRALAGAVAPVMYGQLFAAAVKRGQNPGLTFMFMALVGAIVPEIMLQATPDRELEPPTEKVAEAGKLQSKQQ